MEAENKALKVTNDRVCVECGYACHILDIPFIKGKCPSCKGTEWKEVTYTERLESELKNMRKGAIAEMDEHSNLLARYNGLQAKLDKVMTAHNNSIDLQLKIYDELKEDRDDWQMIAKANHDEMEKLQVKVDKLESSASTLKCHYQAYKAGYECVIHELKEKIDSFGESSSDLKAKFIGEYSWQDELEAHGIDDMEDGETYLENRRVPWTLQKQIFKEMCEYVRNRKDEDIVP